MVLMLASALVFTLAFAAFATDFTVNFDVTNPDVTVTVFKPNNMATNWAWQGTASFNLQGTGSAVGQIVGGHNGVFDMYTDVTGQPTLSGGYTARDGDFASTLNAYSYETDSGYFAMAQWSTHGISATGVTDGSLTVHGDVTAVWGSGASAGALTEGGQIFVGTAASVTVYACKYDSTRQSDPPAVFDPSKFDGADITIIATGDPVEFSGGTEGRTYPGIGDSVDNIYDRVAQDGLGFLFQINGSDLGGVLNTTYEYTNALYQPTVIVGDTSEWLNPPKWIGVPGYLTNP